ncbi:MAG TPA: DinB family protein, partial [Xanthomonadales bacterium]|nr:DinB family protein [Xanthomonadales bacterium]
MDTPVRPSPEHSASLAARYARVRARTEWLVRDLTPEDMAAQSMPDASPAKWHLAHTTWFFERFVLALDRSHAPLVPWADLYNSYYDAVGPQFPRGQRGVLTRPRVDEIRAWRAAVDARVVERLQRGIDAD